MNNIDSIHHYSYVEIISVLDNIQALSIPEQKKYAFNLKISLLKLFRHLKENKLLLDIYKKNELANTLRRIITYSIDYGVKFDLILASMILFFCPNTTFDIFLLLRNIILKNKSEGINLLFFFMRGGFMLMPSYSLVYRALQDMYLWIDYDKDKDKEVIKLIKKRNFMHRFTIYLALDILKAIKINRPNANIKQILKPYKKRILGNPILYQKYKEIYL